MAKNYKENEKNYFSGVSSILHPQVQSGQQWQVVQGSSIASGLVIAKVPLLFLLSQRKKPLSGPASAGAALPIRMIVSKQAAIAIVNAVAFRFWAKE